MINLAHRGLKTNAPENSMKSFTDAIEGGFDGVELDVRSIKSGELVVYHDEDLNRLLGDNRKLSELSASDLENIKLPGGEKIPLVSEVLEKLKGSIINVEIKDSASAKPLAKLLRSYKHLDVIVSSKDKAILRLYRQADKKTPLGFISNHHFIPPVFMARRLRLTHFISHQFAMNWIGLSVARVLRLKIFCYPVKSRFMAGLLRLSAIDGLIEDSDKPLI